MPINKYLPKFIREYLRERRRVKVVGTAIELAGSGRHAEAAKIYEDYAVEQLEESDLSSALYRRYAFNRWLEAKDAQNALQQAVETLRLLCANDGTWIKYDSGEKAEIIVSMVSKFYAAGYDEEGSKLAAEANAQFERHNLPIRCAAEPVSRNRFPVSCEKCGGALPPDPFAVYITCSFCHAAVYAE